MNPTRTFAPFALCAALLAVPASGAGPQAGDCTREGTSSRGFFVGSRVEAVVATVNPAPAKPRKRNRPSTKRADVTDARCIGLGHTLYRRGPGDAPIRVDPASVLRAGDLLRLVLETNVDGYLYVFESSPDGNVMIFPDTQLNRGDNRVRAHTPVEIPSSADPDPSLHWFELTGETGTQRLYFVVSKAPLSGVPTGKALAKAHASARGKPWAPPRAVWTALTADADAAAIRDLATDFGQRQSAEEAEAISRALRLPAKAPEPSIVTVGGGKRVVVTLDLTFR
jgi:hypothetical protein